MLDRIAAAVELNAPSRGRDLASTLAWTARHGWLPFDTDVPATLDSAIRAIDSKLSDQLRVILQHPDFQKLEGAWRGLHYLVASSEIHGTLRIKVLNVSKRELFRDFDRAIEYDQTQVFKKVYENELGTPGGTPFALLIGDYEFTNNHEDLDLLGWMSAVAAASYCPFIGAASPQLFGFYNWAEISRPRNLERIFNATDYAKWRSFRESEDSRFVALVLPRTAARPPFDRGSDQDPEDGTGLAFEEIDRSRPVPHDHVPWMNSAFVLGALLARTFHRDGVFTALMSPRGDEIKGLPTFAFTTDDGDLDWIGPTEVTLSEERCRELSRLGFLPLCRLQDTRSVVFFGGRSVQKPKPYARPEHRADADLASRLSYTLTAARFQHCIQRMSWEWTDAITDAQGLQQELSRWIQRYIGKEPRGWRSRPLREAKVALGEIPGWPGSYEAKILIRPWLPNDVERLAAPIGGASDLA
jgi:type VI secretion system protein ImpC